MLLKKLLAAIGLAGMSISSTVAPALAACAPKAANPCNPCAVKNPWCRRQSLWGDQSVRGRKSVRGEEPLRGGQPLWGGQPLRGQLTQAGVTCTDNTLKDRVCIRRGLSSPCQKGWVGTHSG